MTPQERRLKKQLLLAKGEALRIKLRLELEALRSHPMNLVGQSVGSLKDGQRFAAITRFISEFFPDGRARRWFRLGARALLLWQLAQRLLRR